MHITDVLNRVLFGTLLLSMMSASAQRMADLPSATAWTVGNPTALAVDTAVLREHRALCQRSAAHACVVIRSGQLVDEWYGPNYKEPMYAMSSTKSVTGLLVGILVDQGRVSLDDSVGRFIPQWRAGAEGGVLVRHLLSMTSGIPDNRSVKDVGFVSDKDSLAFGTELAARPGQKWAYSNNGAYLLSPLIRAAAREPVEDFAQRSLFRPLGMHNTKMHVYPAGQAWTHADMETTPKDLARIGQLMLNGGLWQGQQVVSRKWVDSSVVRSQPYNAYGFLWWLDVPNGFAARGFRDTNVYVLPAQELVIVRMQNSVTPNAMPYEPEAHRIFARMVLR